MQHIADKSWLRRCIFYYTYVPVHEYSLRRAFTHSLCSQTSNKEKLPVFQGLLGKKTPKDTCLAAGKEEPSKREGGTKRMGRDISVSTSSMEKAIAEGILENIVQAKG